MIEGIKTTTLKQIEDDRGKVMHMLRSDSENFKKFGEIYFSTVHPNKIKGWHLHTKMTLKDLIAGNADGGKALATGASFLNKEKHLYFP